jgi:hypothetical protein
MLVKRDRVRACRLQRPRGINSGREDWRSAGLLDDMVLIPGVIDSVTNFVEHPRLVGAERVIAGAACGLRLRYLRGLDVDRLSVDRLGKAASAFRRRRDA